MSSFRGWHSLIDAICLFRCDYFKAIFSLRISASFHLLQLLSGRRQMTHLSDYSCCTEWVYVFSGNFVWLKSWAVVQMSTQPYSQYLNSNHTRPMQIGSRKGFVRDDCKDNKWLKSLNKKCIWSTLQFILLSTLSWYFDIRGITVDNRMLSSILLKRNRSNNTFSTSD